MEQQCGRRGLNCSDSGGMGEKEAAMLMNLDAPSMRAGYLEGLWRQALLVGLVWQGVRAPKLTVSVAPSFCCGSVNIDMAG